MSSNVRIVDLYRGRDTVMSFEVFPPKKQEEASIASLYAVIEELTALSPQFISVTYGAGGSENAQRKTGEIAEYIASYDVPALAHLTCVGRDRQGVLSLVDELIARGVGNVLALRGDMPPDREVPMGYRYANELIKDIRLHAPELCIGAACYPEGHIDCPVERICLDRMKAKQDAGADFFVSQLCFDNELFYRFVDKARAVGIHAPISAGIMPILSRKQIERMIFMCGVSLPAQIVKLLHRYEDNPQDLRAAGIDFAAQQAQAMTKRGADGVHIYTMNHPDIATACAQAMYL